MRATKRRAQGQENIFKMAAKRVCMSRDTQNPAANPNMAADEGRDVEQLSTSKSSGDVSARARALLAHFQRGTTVLGLQIALQILQLLECLNIAMQGRQQTISGLLAAVNVAKSAILKLRNDESFNSLIHSTNHMTSKYHLNAIEVPQLRRIPKRIDDGAAESFHPATVGDYYRPQYFELLDTVSVHLTQRFDQEGIQRYEKLEQVLLTGSGMDSIAQYKEIDPLLLKAQLTILSNTQAHNDVLIRENPSVFATRGRRPFAGRTSIRAQEVSRMPLPVQAHILRILKSTETGPTVYCLEGEENYGVGSLKRGKEGWEKE
ncbi:hypothetical protein NDU88_003305 [Pleurodeles waltl]|uniref:Uncharacterized protein n=1 Tax=Pleurodeles waltl TaxID=8319 RepID=A0AAV7Q925_PLEWA|nr:hypothetical protein NDU88_003305 [Pleurodeles waltl]